MAPLLRCVSEGAYSQGVFFIGFGASGLRE